MILLSLPHRAAAARVFQRREATGRRLSAVLGSAGGRGRGRGAGPPRWASPGGPAGRAALAGRGGEAVRRADAGEAAGGAVSPSTEGLSLKGRSTKALIRNRVLTEQQLYCLGFMSFL